MSRDRPMQCPWAQDPLEAQWPPQEEEGCKANRVLWAGPLKSGHRLLGLVWEAFFPRRLPKPRSFPKQELDRIRILFMVEF